MNKITLSVDDKNLETLLTVLKSLKSGMIDNIEINGAPNKVKQTQYQPKTNTIIREEESGTNDKSGKYASVSVYKKRFKK